MEDRIYEKLQALKLDSINLVLIDQTNTVKSTPDKIVYWNIIKFSQL